MILRHLLEYRVTGLIGRCELILFDLNNILDPILLLKVVNQRWSTDTFKNLYKGLGEFTSVDPI